MTGAEPAENCSAGSEVPKGNDAPSRELGGIAHRPAAGATHREGENHAEQDSCDCRNRGRHQCAGRDRKSTRLNSSHTVIYTLSLHDALPIYCAQASSRRDPSRRRKPCGTGFLRLPQSRAPSVRRSRSEERRVGKECRSRCDWSSDVCSSDLLRTGQQPARPIAKEKTMRNRILAIAAIAGAISAPVEIGRASCRERV